MDHRLAKFTRVLLSNSYIFTPKLQRTRFTFSSKSSFSSSTLTMARQYQYHTTNSTWSNTAAKAVATVVATGDANENEPINPSGPHLVHVEGTIAIGNTSHGLRHENRIKSYRYSNSHGTIGGQLKLNPRSSTSNKDGYHHHNQKNESSPGWRFQNLKHLSQSNKVLPQLIRERQPSIWSTESQVWPCFRTTNDLNRLTHLELNACGNNEWPKYHSFEPPKFEDGPADEIHTSISRTCEYQLESNWTLPSYIHDDVEMMECTDGTEVADTSPLNTDGSDQFNGMRRKFEKAEQERKLDNVNFALKDFDKEFDGWPLSIVSLPFLNETNARHGHDGLYRLW